MQVATAPHWSVALHVRMIVPVPIQPVICGLSEYVIVTLEDVGQLVVAVADPVLAGMGLTLQSMVMVGGQVMVTAPLVKVKGAKTSMMTFSHVPLLRCWGLDPG